MSTTRRRYVAYELIDPGLALRQAVRVPAAVYQDMISHALRDAPDECCGIVEGQNNRALVAHPVHNAADEGVRPAYYEMNPDEQFAVLMSIEQRGHDLTAIYHSHPSIPATPSGVDLRLAFWPQAAYLIVSLATGVPHIRAHRLADDGDAFYEVQLFVTDD